MFWCINTDFYDIIAYVDTSKAWKGGMRSKKRLQFDDLLTNETLIYSYLPKLRCGFKQSVFTGRRNQTPCKWKSSSRRTTNLLVQIPTKRTNKEECWKQLCNPPDAPRALAEAPGQISLLSPVNHICRLFKCSN